MTTTPVAIALPSLALADDERALITALLDRLFSFERSNLLHEAYYEGRQRLQRLGISIPPALSSIEVAVGWPGTTVDVLEERLDWQGWTSSTGDTYGLEDVYTMNDLAVDSGLGHLDALIHGTAFGIVGAGFDGEPSPLITVESPMTTTGLWDGRLRRLSSALSIDAKDDAGQPSEVTLYTPDSTIQVAYAGGRWKVQDRDDHGLGRVPVVQFANRPRASRTGGRSEISRAVRAYTDQAVRTLLGMEVNREFYSAPQRYVMGADAEAFTDANGNVRTGWEAIMGRLLAIPANEDGQIPQVGQFAPASPAPYLEQVRGLSQLLAAEAALPAPYLGFVTENPSSADAIRQAEARLIKRAERRQTVFGRAWKEIGALALLYRDGEVPANYGTTVSTKWQDAATPTRSAAADEAVKLVGAQILTPDSSVTLDRIGLSPEEQARLASDRRRANAGQMVSALAAAAQAARQDSNVVSLEAARNGSVGG